MLAQWAAASMTSAARSPCTAAAPPNANQVLAVNWIAASVGIGRGRPPAVPPSSWVRRRTCPPDSPRRRSCLPRCPRTRCRSARRCPPARACRWCRTPFVGLGNEQLQVAVAPDRGTSAFLAIGRGCWDLTTATPPPASTRPLRLRDRGRLRGRSTHWAPSTTRGRPPDRRAAPVRSWGRPGAAPLSVLQVEGRNGMNPTACSLPTAWVDPIPDPTTARQSDKDRGCPARLQGRPVNVGQQVGRYQVVRLPVLRLPPAGLHLGDGEQDVGVLLRHATSLHRDRHQPLGGRWSARC